MIAVFSVIVLPGARHLALSKNTTHPDSDIGASACKIAGRKRQWARRRGDQATERAGGTEQGSDKAEGARRLDDGGRCPAARGRDASVAERRAGTVPKRRVDRGQARHGAAAASPRSTPFPASPARPLISCSPPAPPVPPPASSVCPTPPASVHSSSST